ncbi:LacI family DNA-binding transcriptional regulator [Bacillus taeanensis]|uniref:LacI family transcriptional regulator n=1 Tax=Bacillus taeanensis TaxID=273032 RepID=A0A366XT14_9BACI|nr:LacI family DNA-binding transcriptional regulator [Bacillus taeanensis]RBW69037.1 LacI family transcriptional regulator [Bacillus taeanensis]
MKPTIYNVAEQAGVSIATVSKVINNTGRISDKTKKKVLKVMKELNYQPSVVASALTGKRTQTIGLLIPNIANPFFAEIARSMEDRAHELGFSVVMCSTDYQQEKEEKYISLLIRKQVDGFILASGFKSTHLIEELVKQKIPVALIAHDIASLSLDTVSVDDYKGGYQAVSHLASLGHERISIIAEEVRSNDDRIRGYQDALEAYGLIFDSSLLTRTASTVDAGKQEAERLLRLKERPTAIFASNDILAIGAIQGARACGLSVPEDISIVGFDNTILATISDPPLTTVAQPVHDMGRHVMDLLVEEIEGKKTMKQRMMLSPELVVRNSTAAPLIR